MKDYFSAQSDAYAKNRPTYPKELFEFLSGVTPGHELAWDCGTGNGQAAIMLAESFEKVYATDISKKQLDNAGKSSNIVYALEPAEQISLPDQSVDLVTVSQALHWFDVDNFYKEVRRVSKPGGIIAVWMYGLFQSDPLTDQLISDHYFNTLGKYWDYERSHIDNEYRTIPYPFTEIPPPGFQINVTWNLERLNGYLDTWSAVQKFIEVKGFDPVKPLIEKIALHWPAKEERFLYFPLTLKVGKVNDNVIS